jgi:hypothetical protein
MSSTQEVGDIFGAGKGAAHAMLRSPTVLIVSIGLWGMNMFFFRLFGIQYDYVLNYDLMKMGELHTTNTTTHNNNNNNNINNINNNNNEDTQQQSQQIQESDKKDSSEDVDNHSKDDDPEQQQMISLLPPLEIETTTTTTTTTTTKSSSGSSSSQSTTDNKTASTIIIIAWYKLVLFSVALLALLHVISHYWMDHLGRDVLGAVFWFYGIVLVAICLPMTPHNRWLRKAFAIIVRRSFELVRPRCHSNYTTTNSYCGGEASIAVVVVPRPIPFVDVFYADAMCSLSKVFFDWGMLLHMAGHFPHPVPPSMHNILIPSLFAAVPYIIRARQCLLMHTIGRMKVRTVLYCTVRTNELYYTILYGV